MSPSLLIRLKSRSEIKVITVNTVAMAEAMP
jgi:hypothetical protein